MKPEIVNKDQIILAGLSFFGNPFAVSAEWDEDNEIGLLWKRLMTFLTENRLPGIVPGVGYEMCIQHPETEAKGYFEIFVAVPVAEDIIPPPQLCLKKLPAATYAKFTLHGTAIESDWTESMFRSWLPDAGLHPVGRFNLQYYDHRFKGMDNLEESAIDVLVPIADPAAVQE